MTLNDQFKKFSLFLTENATKMLQVVTQCRCQLQLRAFVSYWPLLLVGIISLYQITKVFFLFLCVLFALSFCVVFLYSNCFNHHMIETNWKPDD